MLWVARDRLYVVKVIPQGTRISGSSSGSTWKLGGSVNDAMKNPLPALENQRRALLPYLSAKGFEEIMVEPLVICADTYETPRFKIDGFSSIYTYSIWARGVGSSPWPSACSSTWTGSAPCWRRPCSPTAPPNSVFPHPCSQY